ncbi:MAG: protein kinase [Candidatus Latescibacteria bacterium]|nr:protein kinase [Candidatus Latescibacterota bacterium]NIM64438.1 protein kinase [Candidatus Latescibacterota bacterium]NIO00592.1 protein kinase [Candidatus Latescibacterota bacterium]NIO26992.1 protein kinase [Candidatus Latescibacterota bacterium]NIO56069.1 protein kinase [Candidatus Latescibacterota bacterium]
MIGRTISRYKILEELGEGGMGVVYRAEDTKLKRTVALKFLPLELTSVPEAKERFIHEAQAASSLEHPNICTIYEIDETSDGQLFIVMSYYEGESLRERLDRGASSIEEAFDIVLQIASGLAAAHKKGIVHRDIKPANILITTDDQAKIVDFGLAKLTSQAKTTSWRSTVGTVAYMSPEQARDEDIDERTDIFSLGAVLHELLAGRAPFTGDHEAALLYGIMNTDLEPVSVYRSDVPEGLQDVLNKAMHKDKEKRYQSIAELKNDLEELREATIKKKSPGVPGAKRFFGEGGRISLLRAFSIIVVVLIVALIGWRFVLKSGLLTPSSEHALAIMDFRDLVASDDMTISIGITELVNIGLIESSPIRVISPEYLQDLRRRLFGTTSEPIREAEALELARHSGATLILSGKIAQLENEQYATWRLVDARNGNSLGARRIEGSNLIRLADQIIADVLPLIASESGAESPSEPPSVGALTTASPEAYKHYIAGAMARREYRTRDAIQELEKAVNLDSAFARALFELSLVQYSMSSGVLGIDRARAYADSAWEKRIHLALKDRMRLEAWQQTLHYRIPDAKATYNEMLARWPDDREILSSFSEFLVFQWYLEDAIRVSEQGLQLYPDDATLGLVYGAALALTDRSEEALQASRTYVEQHPDNPNAWDEQGSRFLALGLPDSAETSFRKCLEVNPEFYWCEMHLASCAYSRGDLTLAIETIKDILDQRELLPHQMIEMIADPVGSPSLALLYAEQGRLEKALEEFERARQFVTDSNVEARFELNRSLLLLRAGLADEAMRTAQRLAKCTDAYRPIVGIQIRARALAALDSLDAARAAVEEVRASERIFGGRALLWFHKVAAEIALAEGDPEEALKMIREMSRYGVFPGALEDIEYREAMARAHRMAGRLDEAAGVHEEMLRVYGGHALSHYELGQFYEEMGRKADAKKEYAKFLEMWSRADEGLPQMADARQRLTALKSISP